VLDEEQPKCMSKRLYRILETISGEPRCRKCGKAISVGDLFYSLGGSKAVRYCPECWKILRIDVDDLDPNSYIWEWDPEREVWVLTNME